MDFTDLNSLSKNIVEVYDPDVYSHNVDIIDKPMADIPFGHILNVNWDNIARCFGILQNYLYQAVYTDMVSQANIANTLVQRGADGGIQVGDIYTTTGLESGVIVTGVGIAFKGADNKIRFDTDIARLKDVIGIKNPIAGENLAVDVDWSGTELSYNSSVNFKLKENSQNYSAILVYGAGDPYLAGVWESAVLLPEIWTSVSFAGKGSVAATWHKSQNILEVTNGSSKHGKVLFALGLF